MTKTREREIASTMQRPFKLSLLLLVLLALKSGVLCLPSESANYEVSALAAFKQAIYEDPRSVMSDWNAHDSDPCSWSGVICSSSHGHVISLNLSSSFLKGFLAPEVGSLSSLQELYVSYSSSFLNFDEQFTSRDNSDSNRHAEEPQGVGFECESVLGSPSS